MMTVDEMLEALVGREGGYTNNPADRGGPTMWGITEQVARAYGYTGDMSALPRQTALAIYRKRYWLNPHFDQVSLRYPTVAAELFDTGVNMGQAVASKFLQHALNLLNRGASAYPDIGIDGGLGELSLHALDSYVQLRGAPGQAVLLKTLEIMQGDRYIAIVDANPSQETFFYGWIANRIGNEL
jgi:lysozyme family protein